MNGNSGSAVRILAMLFVGFFSWTLVTAQGGADSLESQLTAKYKLVKLGTDSSGLSVVDPGTVLVIKKGGILSVASGNMVVIPSYVKDGQIKTANNSAMTGVNKLMKWKGVSDPTGTNSTDTKFLTTGEKVYVSKIDINRHDSKVTLAIIECDTCNETKDPSLRKASVVFQFPKDYLNGADGGQISDVINQILEIQADDAGAQQAQGQDAQAQQSQQQAPQQEAPAAAPATIQLGQSLEEVQAALGAPTKIVNLGPKQIYVYKDLKVTFIRGKVVDVQ
jgi:hypothetical protein